MNEPAAASSSRSRLKARLLALFQSGAGSLVVASTVLAAPPPTSVSPVPGDSPLKRAEDARARIVQSLPAAEQTGQKPVELAWWGNRWGNGGWHPWNNWPNAWRNWPNWGNWGPGRRSRWW